jgi:excinuclease UvrABC helicase subunit UvrB
MKEAAKNLEFEEAMQLRDIIFELKSRWFIWVLSKKKRIH